MERSLLIDIGASQIVALLASFAFPHLFQDMRVVVKDLSVLTRAELDFRIEAQSQATARELLAASELGGAVFVPEVFPALATRRVLGMEYVEGENIKEVRRRGASELEVTRIVTALVDAFSLTMHGEIFNCDPHPGNLMVLKDGRPAIIDWVSGPLDVYLLFFWLFITTTTTTTTTTTMTTITTTTTATSTPTTPTTTSQQHQQQHPDHQGQCVKLSRPQRRRLCQMVILLRTRCTELVITGLNSSGYNIFRKKY